MTKLLALLVVLIATQLFGSNEDAQKFFLRFTGTRLLLTDQRLEQISLLLEQKKFRDAAKIATDDTHFYRVIVRNFASILTNAQHSPFVTLDDFQAFVIGVVRDRIDARLLLSGDFHYEGDPKLLLPAVSLSQNLHFEKMESLPIDWEKSLIKVSPQWEGLKSAAGLLTTRSWAKSHYFAGTNRRAVQYSFEEFLCLPIERWRQPGLDDRRVRRDVDRMPGGDLEAYDNGCRHCHAGMDALGGAFARFDFVADSFVWGSFVAPKMNHNAHVYSEGFKVNDDSWINLSTTGHNAEIGWRGKLVGMGLKEYGTMLANTRAFSMCMAKRVYEKICAPEKPAATDLLNRWADHFEGRYDLKDLFEHIGSSSLCGWETL